MAKAKKASKRAKIRTVSRLAKCGTTTQYFEAVGYAVLEKAGHTVQETINDALADGDAKARAQADAWVTALHCPATCVRKSSSVALSDADATCVEVDATPRPGEDKPLVLYFATAPVVVKATVTCRKMTVADLPFHQ